MRIRVHLKEPNNTGAPDYTMCGQGVSDISVSNISFIVLVNNTSIAFSTDLSAFAGVGPISAGGINVSISAYGGNNIVEIDIALVNVTDSATVFLQFSKNNYNIYQNTFTVYGYDLGDNHLGDYPDNSKFEIVLVPSEISGTPVNNAYASAIFIRQPFTNTNYYYDATSSNGEKYLALIEETIPTDAPSGNVVISNGAGETWTYYNHGGDVVCSTDYLIPKKNICPPIILIGNCPTCEEGCEYLLNTDADFIPTADWSDVPVISIDSGTPMRYEFSTIEFDYQLLDINDVEIDTYSTSIANPDTSILYDATTVQWDVQPPSSGFHYVKLTVTLKDGAIDVYTCTFTINVPVCDTIDITKTDCNVYSVFNHYVDRLTINIYSLSNTGVMTLILEEIDIESAEAYIFEPETDGVYIIGTVGGIVKYYSIIADCNIENCLLASIGSLLDGCLCKSNCACDGNSSATDKRFQFSSLIAMYSVYTFIYNDEKTLTGLMQNIKATTLAYYADIQKLIENILALKDDCNVDSICGDC